jgi:hypothetical protein
MDETKKDYGQCYYAEFDNKTGSKYFFIFDKGGKLIDSQIRSGSGDTYALKVLESKYGKCVKLSVIPPLSFLPVSDSYLALQKEASQFWETEWSKIKVNTDSITPNENKGQRRFIVVDKLIKEAATTLFEGIQWTNGAVTVMLNSGTYTYPSWDEFYTFRMKDIIWKSEVIWLDSAKKSKEITDRFLSIYKSFEQARKDFGAVVEQMKSL